MRVNYGVWDKAALNKPPLHVDSNKGIRLSPIKVDELIEGESTRRNIIYFSLSFNPSD